MKNTKLILTLAVFFCMDLIRPFGYGFNAEFLLCGIIFLALHYRLSFAMPCAFVFGYAKDIVLETTYSINMIEFVFICLGTHYLMRFFLLTQNKTKIIAKSIVVFVAIVIHVFLNAAQANLFNPWYVLHFFMHTILAYWVIDYLLERWIMQCSFHFMR